MWSDGWLDWAILLLGYVLVLAILRLLGGFAAAGTAFRNWGKAHTSRQSTLGSSS